MLSPLSEVPYQRILLPFVHGKHRFAKEKYPCSLLCSSLPAKSGRKCPDKGTYCLSMVTGPQPKLWSVGICVKFKTAVRQRKKKEKHTKRIETLCLYSSESHVLVFVRGGGGKPK